MVPKVGGEDTGAHPIETGIRRNSRESFRRHAVARSSRMSVSPDAGSPHLGDDARLDPEEFP